MNTTLPDSHTSSLQDHFLHFANILPEALLLINALGEIIIVNQKASDILNIQSLTNKHLTDVTNNSAKQIDFYLKIWSRSRMPTPANLLWRSDDVDSQPVTVKKKYV